MARLPRIFRRGAMDPRRSHPFRATAVSGITAAASGGLLTANDLNTLAVTPAAMRETPCAVPGCGKTRQDPIHSPAEA